jgi:exo-beta-1,3-glucanase (GH17 family)
MMMGRPNDPKKTTRRLLSLRHPAVPALRSLLLVGLVLLLAGSVGCASSAGSAGNRASSASSAISTGVASVPGKPAAPPPLQGLCFSPFLNTTPADSSSLTPETISGLMSKISPYTYGIRTFSATGMGQEMPSLARANNLKVAAGCDLSNDPAYNEQEVQALIALCRNGQVDLAVVGEEALYFNYASEEQLTTYIQRVKATGVPTTTSDTWGELIGHPGVVAQCDVILANMFPYWEGQDINVAIPYLDRCYNKVRQAYLFKQIMVETGWPTAGETKGAAEAGLDNATKFLSGFSAWANAHSVKYYYFEAFDEPWKATHEGEVGAHWGIWDDNGVMKPGMSEVVGPR